MELCFVLVQRLKALSDSKISGHDADGLGPDEVIAFILPCVRMPLFISMWHFILSKTIQKEQITNSAKGSECCC
jgi:hypothetical protein